ncbi:MAG: caspase family protein [Deltaproteobacteria bacterium]|nr:caspase family protein [Deltaproteobacteria bacterium]
MCTPRRWAASSTVSQSCSDAGTKRALLIGVSDYGYDDGWNDLHASTDLEYLSGALSLHGFESRHIKMLKDANATAAKVEGHLETLLEVTERCDHVFVHFSGHGQQLEDLSGDEGDGRDEALVTYGAPHDSSDDYDGSLHLSDDRLGEWLGRVRSQVGPEGTVVLSADSCWSGTISRGGVQASDPQERGGADWIRLKDDRSSDKRERDDVGFADAATGASSPGDGPLVVLTAARDFETAKETNDRTGRPVGSLSLALSEVLTADPPPRTWGEAYERVAAKMSEWHLPHVPQLEGRAEVGVFDGEVTETEPYFRIRTSRGNGTELVLAGGTLLGLTVGSLVEVHGAGASDVSGRALATGTVTSASASLARVGLDVPLELPRSELLAMRVFVTEPAPGNYALALRVELNGEVGAAWRSAFKDDARFDLERESVDFVVRHRTDLPEPEVCRAPQGCTALFPSSDPGHPAAVAPGSVGPDATTDAEGDYGPLTFAQVVERLMYGGLLQAVDLRGDPAQFAVRLEVVSRDTASPLPTRGESVQVPLVPDGTDGGEICFRAVSRGASRVHLALVYVDDRGLPMQLVPDLDGMPVSLPGASGGEEARIQLGDCLTPRGEPGPGTLKLFATREAVNFGPLVGYAPTGGNDRGGQASGALQQLIDELGSGARGGFSRGSSDRGTSHVVRIDMIEQDAVESQ